MPPSSRARVRRFGCGLLLTALLAGCAGGASTARPDTTAKPGSPSSDRAVYTDLIRRMLASGQYYAALAHIQQQQTSSGNTEELRFLEAEARRKLGQYTAAETLYKGLLKGSQSAGAYHGLGLLYAPRYLTVAITYLRVAVQKQPTDAESRNDLGYALLQAGRLDEAMPELATAVELAPDDDRPRNNLLLLTLVRGDEKSAQKIINDSGVPADVVTRLRTQAQTLKARFAGTGVRK